MKNILLLAGAAIALTMGASAVSADDSHYYDDSYRSGGDNSWPYQQQDYGNYGSDSQQHRWNNGGYNYRHDVVSTWSIVRDLERNHYRNISQPVLSGMFYQVKATDPGGHKVKLYIDSYSGRISKVKS